MGLSLGDIEISASLGGVEPEAICLGDKEIWTSFTPFEKSFAYTGGIQSLAIPSSGIYKLEVYGASSSGMNVGRGGYSVGYKKLTKGTTVYVCVGGSGGSVSGNNNQGGGGYNGGGNAYGDGYGNTFSGGGGATHVALVSGTIASIGKTDFDTYGLLVAGGGGGAIVNLSGYWSGGYGGGNSGGNGIYGPHDVNRGYGATQTTGFAFGQGAQGGRETSNYWNGNSGGGGYYGGGHHSGGSGWIGGVPEITFKGMTYRPTTTSNINSGNGKAKITRIV